jgi:transcriptional regulator with XRE-family HTH domain
MLRKSSTSLGTPARPETLALWRVLAEARKAANISQETLAFEAGYHPKYVSILERGLSSPSLKALLKLAAVLKTSAWEMVRHTEVELAKSKH